MTYLQISGVLLFKVNSVDQTHFILGVQTGLQAFISTFTVHWRGEYNLS